MTKHGLPVTAACALMALATPARSDDRLADVDPARAESNAYCAWVDGLADGDRALLLAPELFSVTSSAATGSEETGDEDFASDVAMRQSVGLRLRASRFHRARLLRLRSEAECRRYRAKAALGRLLRIGRDLGLAEGLGAEISVLEEALVEAEARVAEVRRGLEARTTTAQELLAAELKLEQIVSRVQRSRLRRAELLQLADAVPAPVSELLEAFRAADTAVAALETQLRESNAWEIDLRGGYDQILDDPREVPAFGAVTITVSLGALLQRRAHATALRHHAHWRSLEHGGFEGEVARLVHELRVAREHAEQRLERLRPLRDDLRARVGRIERIDGIVARQHRDTLWFEYRQLQAEISHSEARLARLRELLAGRPG